MSAQGEFYLMTLGCFPIHHRGYGLCLWNPLSFSDSSNSAKDSLSSRTVSRRTAQYKYEPVFWYVLSASKRLYFLKVRGEVPQHWRRPGYTQPAQAARPANQLRCGLPDVIQVAARVYAPWYREAHQFHRRVNHFP